MICVKFGSIQPMSKKVRSPFLAIVIGIAGLVAGYSFVVAQQSHAGEASVCPMNHDECEKKNCDCKGDECEKNCENCNNQKANS